MHKPVLWTLKEVEAAGSEAQGHLCLYNKLEASVSYRGPGLKENNKKKKTPTPLLGVMAESQPRREPTPRVPGPYSPSPRKKGAWSYVGVSFVGRGCGLTKLGRCGRNKESVWSLELVGPAPEGVVLWGRV